MDDNNYANFNITADRDTVLTFWGHGERIFVPQHGTLHLIDFITNNYSKETITKFIEKLSQHPKVNLVQSNQEDNSSQS